MVSTNIFFKNDDDLYELNISKAIQYIKVIQKIKKIDEQIINERKLNKKNLEKVERKIEIKIKINFKNNVTKKGILWL